MKTIRRILLSVIVLFTTSLFSQEKAFKVEVIGKGAPVLLFPGFTCTGEVWDDTVKELSKTNECHIFTFAGFGDVPAIKKPWFPKIRESVENYITEQNLGNVILIGHSMGGSLALSLATTNKSKLKKIMIVDALPSIGALMMPNFKSEYIVYDNPYNQQILEMDADGFDKMATQFAHGMSLNTEKHEQIKKWILESDRETYVYGYSDLLKLDLREEVSKIEIPVVILAATQPYGEATVKANYETQYKNLKNYTIKYAKESAHFIMYDQPEWFITAVKSEL